MCYTSFHIHLANKAGSLHSLRAASWEGCRREEWYDATLTMHTYPKTLLRPILSPSARPGDFPVFERAVIFSLLRNPLLLGGTSPKWATPAYIATVPSLGRPRFCIRGDSFRSLRCGRGLLTRRGERLAERKW
jgi:hypothetical protein